MITREIAEATYPFKPLGEVATFLDHKRRPVKQSERKTGTFPYYGANGLQGTIDSFIFDEPLILLAEDGGHFDEPHRGIAYEISGKTWVNNHAHVLKPRNGNLDLAYLRRVLENYDVRPFINGSTRSKLTKAQAERISIPLPPLDEQRRIAAILDKADALRRKRKRAFEVLGDLSQSIFLEMFGDPVANPHGFQVCPLSEIAKFMSGGTPSKDIEEYWNGDIPWVSPKDMKVVDISDSEDHVSESAIVQTSLKLIEPTAILIVVRGMILAHSFPIAISRRSLAINQDMKAIRIDAAYDPLFVFWCLKVQANYILSKVSTAAHGTKRLEMQDLEQLPVLLPPQKMQRDFVRKAQIVSRTIESTKNALRNDDTLFSSLQHRAFSGQL